MPIEAVKIPQNVYVEDRLIGPITIRQLIIVGIGAGISYVIFAAVTKAGYDNVVIGGICWSPTLVAAMFAFLKINDLSLFHIILLMIENYNKPTMRYWSPHVGLSVNLITSQHAKEMVEATKKATQNADKLADITRQMEKRQEELNRLTAHEMPTPGAVEAVTTQLAGNIPHGTHEHEDTGAAEDQSPAPVRAERVSASGLDPMKSIDGVAPALGRFEHLFADAPQA